MARTQKISARSRMTRAEAEYQAAQAGHAAAQQAAQAGVAPPVLRALISQETDTPAPALNAMVALDMWWQSAARKQPGMSAIFDTAATVFCFRQPDLSIDLLLKEDAQGFRTEVAKFSASVSLRELKTLSAEIAVYLADLFPAASDAGKS